MLTKRAAQFLFLSHVVTLCVTPEYSADEHRSLTLFKFEKGMRTTCREKRHESKSLYIMSAACCWKQVVACGNTLKILQPSKKEFSAGDGRRRGEVEELK